MNLENGRQLDFSLEHDQSGQLVLVDAQGVRHAPVEGVRGFPISDPDHWISICDVHGRELALVGDLAALAPSVRQALEDDLARREFVPRVRRIWSAPADAEPAEWDVDTDRGRTRFLLKSHDDVRRLGPRRAMIIDAKGIRYLIDDVDGLDTSSRRLLDRFL